MQARRLTTKDEVFLSPLAFTGIALLVSLSGMAQEQTTPSGPEPSAIVHSAPSADGARSSSTHPSATQASDRSEPGRAQSAGWGGESVGQDHHSEGEIIRCVPPSLYSV